MRSWTLHPLLRLVPGAVRDWEKVASDAAAGIKPKRTRAPATPHKPKLWLFRRRV